jgi:hypothetical protein
MYASNVGFWTYASASTKKYLTLYWVTGGWGGGALKRYNLGATTGLDWEPPAALAPERMSSDPTEWEGHRAPRPVSIFTEEISLCYGQDSIPGL